jgi:3D (Asp-Asp-Asp) domain-containing protein
MKPKRYIIALILTVSVCISLCFVSTQSVSEKAVTLSAENEALKRQIDSMSLKINTTEKEYQKQIDTLTTEISTLRQEVERIDKTDRGGEERGQRRVMEVTAYDLSYQSCQKYPDDPLYGVTASGERVKEWYTVAAGPEIPFGTKIYIPYFADKPNGGIFTVQDRGGGIDNGQIDVYIKDYNECMEFGRRELEVYILWEVEG